MTVRVFFVMLIILQVFMWGCSGVLLEDFNEITIENGYYKVIEKDVSLLKVMIYDTNKEILYYYYVR